MSAIIFTLISFIGYLTFKRLEPNNPLYVTSLLLLPPLSTLPVARYYFKTLYGTIFVTFTSYYVLLFFFTAVYRISPIHPLAKYPGPLPNKLSKIWMVYVVSKGKQHIYYHDLHAKYGDVVRVGPNELSVRNLDAVHPVLGAKGLPKGPFWDNPVPPGRVASLIAQRDPTVHHTRRQPWNRAFSSSSLKNYEEIIVPRSRELADCLRKREGEIVDLSMWFSFFAFDFMGDLAFGSGFGLMEAGCDKEGYWRMLTSSLKYTTMATHISWCLPWLRLFRRASALRGRNLGVISREIVMKRIEQGSKTKDILYHLIDEEGVQPEKPTVPVVISDAVLVMVAGSDTTSSALSAIWYFLLKDPVALARVRAEVDSAFQGKDTFDFAKMSGLPYVNAVINEALRLLPPLLSGSQRSSPHGSGGKMIGPCFIPEGNQVFLHTYSLHRDPRYFSIPNTFWPDRWISAEDRKPPTNGEVVHPDRFVHDTGAYLPFSVGPANCAGKNLALLELRALVCHLLREFDFYIPEGEVQRMEFDDWERGVCDYFVMSRPILPVVIKSRV